MNPIFKTILTAAAGGAIPAIINTQQTCGSDPKLLATQMAAGAGLAVFALFAKQPNK